METNNRLERIYMTDEKWAEINEFYLREFPDDMTLDEITAKLDTLNDHPDIQILRQTFCNELVSMLTEGFVMYNENDFNFKDGSLWSVTLSNIEKLTKDHYFYWAFYYYVKKDYKKCKEYIHKLCSEDLKDGAVLDEAEVLNLFLIPFKNAPDQIWDFITKELKSIKTSEGIPEFCELISLFYRSTSNEGIMDAISDFMQKYPDYKTPNEMLGYTYYCMSMWHNAIACFEKVDEMFYFPMANIYWMLAWASGKVKNLANEEMYYRKSLELAPDMAFTANNLGYCLYQQKKYREALEIFDKCLNEKKDLPNAANNYVRVLITLGRNADAKRFVKSGKFKISKTLKDRVSKLDNHNARLKKDAVSEQLDLEEDTTEKIAIDIGIKRHQFYNEKLLEDELTARIESGVPVFGLNLKMYKRKGEYGRQFIIPVGRLDLLCEDNAGNLYVIELKKDSGYDDAYKQTAEYLDWFEQSEKFKGKKIYGIICLNNPTQQLIDNVHADKRMKLFEYQISYTER